MPNNVTKLSFSRSTFDDIDEIEVVGGTNVIDTSVLFYGCRAKVINLSKFRPKELKDVAAMFEECYADNIDISHLNIAEDADREEMFTDYSKNIKMSLKEKQIHIKLFCEKIKNTLGIDLQVKDTENNKTILKVKTNKYTTILEIDTDNLLNALYESKNEIEAISNNIEGIEDIIKTEGLPLLSIEYNSEYKGKWYIDLKNYDSCISKTTLGISSIKDNEIKYGLYRDTEDETIKWIVKDIDYYDISKFINDERSNIETAIQEISEVIGGDLDAFHETISYHEDAFSYFTKLVDEMKEKGIDIQINGGVIENNSDGVYDKAEYEIELYGYQNAPNFIDILTVFTSDTNKDGSLCSIQSSENLVTYGGDVGIWSIGEYTKPNDYYASGAMYFIEALERIANNCKSGDVIRLAMTEQDGLKQHIVQNNQDYIDDAALCYKYVIDHPAKLKFSVNGEIIEVTPETNR